MMQVTIEIPEKLAERIQAHKKLSDWQIAWLSMTCAISIK